MLIALLSTTAKICGWIDEQIKRINGSEWIGERSLGIYTQWNTMRIEEEIKSRNSIQSKIVQKFKNISNKYTKLTMERRKNTR